MQGAKYVRNYLLSSLGYVVISIDSRGSSNRGKAFESHIYKRLGQVELKDQLEVLNLLASDMAFLDMTRVAINGWSYGGYLALRGLVDHPDFFKVVLNIIYCFYYYFLPPPHFSVFHTYKDALKAKVS